MELIKGPKGLSGAVKKEMRTLQYAVMSTKQAKHQTPVIRRTTSDRRSFKFPISPPIGPATYNNYNYLNINYNM